MDEEGTPCCSTQKRRSTFHRRRSALQFQSKDVCNKGIKEGKEEQLDGRMLERIKNSYKNEEESNPNPNENKDGSSASSFDLQKYINDLKRERKTWQETLLNRKRQRKIIMKEISNTQKCEQDIDLSALSETERNFLLERPNYEHICEKAKKLAIMATETSILNQHVMHLHKRSISRAEKKINNVTKRVIELVD